MNDRMQRYVGAGILVTGLLSGTLIGASIAAADPESGVDNASEAAESPPRHGDDHESKTSDAQPDSSTSDTRDEEAEGAEPGANGLAEPGGSTQDGDESAAIDTTGDAATDAVDATDGEAIVVPVAEPAELPEPSVAATPAEPAEAVPAPVDTADGDAPTTREPVAPRVVPGDAIDVDTVKPEAPAPEAPAPAAPEPVVEPAMEPETTVGGLVAAARSTVADAPNAAIVTAIAAARVVAPPPPAGPTLVNVLGSLAWSVFDYINRILQGPPVVPAGSGLKVGRSDLSIDCGDGYIAQADWYFPEDGEADKLIYFQHGFLATSGFYNLTAAELAERNNAIVVAPSITSDFFACDACNLTGDPMHAGVGMLFAGDRAALTTSARAAAERAGVEFTGLPSQFVIAGHSAGGQLAAGAAGYFHLLAPASDESNLVGVLLLDTSATGGGLGRALDRLPSTLPVLHISGNPGPLNTYGNANEELEAKRPGQFNGVRLVGGSHSDAFRSSTLFGLTQVIVSLGTGASTPENVEAVQVLAQGWITDMYAGTVYDSDAPRAGIYGPLGDVVEVPTPGVGSGVALAHVLPVPPVQLSFIDSILKTLLNSLTATQGLASCAVDPVAASSLQIGESARHSTADTALSLDERRQTGQSVGQHGCTS